MAYYVYIYKQKEGDYMRRNRQHYFKLMEYDPKKVVYAMLTSGVLTHCECSIINNNPTQHNASFIVPRDAYIGKTITEKNVGTYSDFLVKLGPNSNNVLQCVCALDESDKERVVYLGLSIAESIMAFFTTRKSKHDPEKILEQLKSKYNEVI